jgi:Domain of unknown function (DUF4160)
MPEITTFYGIRITMYYNDHLPPHFHAEYNEDEVLIEINSLEIYAGELPKRALRFTLEWARLSSIRTTATLGTEPCRTAIA